MEDDESAAEDELSELSENDDDGYGKNKLNNKTRWTKHEDAALKTLVEQYGERWDSIAKCLKDRTDIQCQQRWTKVVNPELIKGTIQINKIHFTPLLHTDLHKLLFCKRTMDKRGR